MNPIILFLAATAFAALFPSTARVLGNAIAVLFIFPFLSVAMGSVAWGAVELFTGAGWSWTTCVVVFGVPFGLLMAVPCTSAWSD